MNSLQYRKQWPMLRPYCLAKHKDKIVECISYPWKQDNIDLIKIREPGNITSIQTIEVNELTQIMAICSKCNQKFESYYFLTNKLQCSHCNEHYKIENLEFV